ncbi:sensor histidine kinase [Spirilliplanes yamanashiensis]|uniref:histidine kinase n=1 Tax=Spirilliplanes yamanashiensis TaxID=42233 RepID=A0A8J3YB59_9ACTN|nr:HAMP domain-containing sensor histidine kinase [Spirilliplanes yamanashiensis]MDP9819021.1 signal transduction histidine kinase [Spirilliplanes yamanashiensis]GIJ05476.1 two-component sensor histidine kinase [Spirilliplanes yamanashiensis]
MTRRLLVTYLTFALLILVALEVPLGWVYHRGAQRQAADALEHDAEVLAAFVDTALTTGRGEQVHLLAREAAQRLGGQVDVVGAGGRLLSSTHPERHAPGGPGAAPDVRAVLAGRDRVTGRAAGPGTISVAVPVHPGVAARGAVRVSVPTAPTTARVRRFWLLLAAAGIAVLLAAALVAVALARWISRPVRELERATARLPGGPLPPPPTTGPPELRRLAAAFHATAGRVQGLLEAQRAFAGHASHQLKTPLAALRLRLENLEPDVTAGGAAGLRAALAETDRLAGLVESLLALARAERGTLPRERVGLPGAVAGRVEVWAPLAAGRGVGLVADGPADAHVAAVPGAVDQILDNLLANALRAAPAGSAVTVSWRPGPAGDVELHVADRGPGLTDEQRERALDPFWRAPGAAPGGTGLGLALVRTLAEAGGGGAALRPAPGGSGLDAVVTFPAGPAAALSPGRPA